MPILICLGLVIGVNNFQISVVCHSKQVGLEIFLETGNIFHCFETSWETIEYETLLQASLQKQQTMRRKHDGHFDNRRIYVTLTL